MIIEPTNCLFFVTLDSKYIRNIEVVTFPWTQPELTHLNAPNNNKTF